MKRTEKEKINRFIIHAQEGIHVKVEVNETTYSFTIYQSANHVIHALEERFVLDRFFKNEIRMVW